MNKILKFSQFMGVIINFVISPPSSLSKVVIRLCIFHAAASPGTRVSFICVSQYSPDHKALNCKNDNGTKWTKGSRNHVKFPAFANWLSTRLRHLQCICYWNTNLGPYNLYMTCWIWQSLVHVMTCCLIATEHRAICVPLQTIIELSLKILNVFKISYGIKPDFTGNSKYNY